ncbi:MAG TPA: winged helix-turn-helix domain-containing protein, partial [bacterium]
MGYYDSPDLNPQGEGQDLVVPTGKDSWQRHSRSTRKRKGKVETYTYGGRAHLLKAIEQKGEAIPGDLARELGWSRSTLAHNLAKLQAKGKIVRMGGGRSTRYRVVTPDEALPGTPPPQAPDPGE